MMKFPLSRSVKKMAQRMANTTTPRFVKIDIFGVSIVLDRCTIYGRRLSDGLLYEPETIAFVQNLKSDADKIGLDIGASHGLYSLLLSKKYRTVFSFEPNQQSRYILNYNLNLNDCHNVLVSDNAVSDSTGSKRFYMSRDSSRDSFFPMQYAKKVRMVQTIRIDDMNIKANRIALIKIDVEGAELKVLYGMRDTIERNQGAYIIVEFIPRNQGFNAEELFDFFDSWNHRGLDWNMLFWRE